MKAEKLKYVTAIHGNEPMPVFAIASLGISQYVANISALINDSRYIEKDMNTSFGTTGNSVEEVRARELSMELNKVDGLLVDFHTFSCKSIPFAIIVDLAMLPLAASLGVENVVYMKHNIKAGHALINHHPGVSVEVGEHRSAASFEQTRDIVKKLERDGIKAGKVRLYEVYDRITKKGDYVNFKEKNGLIPVLYGERAYDGLGFYGLAAREITGTIQKEENI